MGGGDDGISDLASMMGGSQMGGGQGPGPQPLPPELMKMMAAQALAPHVLATQQTEYYKKFLQILVRLLGDFRREQQVGPRTSADVARAQTQLTAAIAKLDKEKPEEADPVNSLLAQGMMDKPMMSAGGAPGGGIPIMR